MKKKSEINVGEELRAIKKLLVLQMINKEVTPNDIRNVLKLSGSSFKKLIPIKKK